MFYQCSTSTLVGIRIKEDQAPFSKDSSPICESSVEAEYFRCDGHGYRSGYELRNVP
jgi:hypothetical protein